MISVKFCKLLKPRSVVHGYSAKDLQFLRVFIRPLSSTKPGAVGSLVGNGVVQRGPKQQPEGSKGKPGSSQPMIIIPTNKASRPRLIHQNQNLQMSAASSEPSASVAPTITAASGKVSPSLLRFPHDDYAETDLSNAEQLQKAYDDAYQYCKCKETKYKTRNESG